MTEIQYLPLTVWAYSHPSQPCFTECQKSQLGCAGNGAC